MIVSQRIALNPNNAQATHFRRACGTARYAYNWARQQWEEQHKAGKKPTAFRLCKQFNAIKKAQFPWTGDVTCRATENAILNLGNAYKKFFKKTAKYPRFKKKGIRDSFEIHNEDLKIEPSSVYVPKLGWVRSFQPIRFQGRILSGVVSRHGHRWFLSVAIETKNPFPQSENQAAVGVDLGVSTMATLSTGEKLTGPKPHFHLLKRLRRLNKSLARKVKGSKNRDKAKMKLSRLHTRIKNIRHHSIHQLTSRLVKNYGVIGIEDLNVAGMVKNRHLSRAISDMGFYEFKRQLKYKAEWRGVQVVEVNRFFPSSKTCSECGLVVESLPLSVREWQCECGAKHDRDVNAAINLRNMAVKSTVSACGETGSGLVRKSKTKPVSMKQESTSHRKVA
jgi:putative transposase